MSEQKKVKPKIDDVGQHLTPDRAAAMLNLIDFIRANKIGIQNGSGLAWSLRYKGKQFGSLHVHDGTWRFAHRDLDKYYEMDECDLKSFAFEHIYANCGIIKSCQWNEEYPKAGYMNPTNCGCWPLRIFNPDGEALELTKQLIEFRKNHIIEEWQASKS